MYNHKFMFSVKQATPLQGSLIVASWGLQHPINFAPSLAAWQILSSETMLIFPSVSKDLAPSKRTDH